VYQLCCDTVIDKLFYLSELLWWLLLLAGYLTKNKRPNDWSKHEKKASERLVKLASGSFGRL